MRAGGVGTNWRVRNQSLLHGSPPKGEGETLLPVVENWGPRMDRAAREHRGDPDAVAAGGTL